MFRRLQILALAALLALSALSCASAGFTPASNPMPAARAGLPPEYRFFYDALADYGDWVLIEPWGWVFQPRVNWLAWRPYEFGFWVPSAIYGWTWVSTEPFGWATYHYGQWIYDSFQGWVWIPGLDWGPAWVAWNQGDGYTGWAPLMPSESYWNAVPGGAFLYVPTSQLPATDLSQHVLKAGQIGGVAGRLAPVMNPGERAGVTFNRGPLIEDVERAVDSPLPRVRLEERGPAFMPMARRARPMPAGHEPAADSAAAMRRAADEATREARTISNMKSRTPDRLPIVRPRRPRRAPDDQGEEKRERPEGERPGRETPAPPDTSS